jgi:hypothetical protein
MAPGRNRRNLVVGLALITLVSAPTLSLLLSEFRRPAFAADNRWLWLALACCLPLGFGLSAIGLRQRIHWGYFVWSQSVLAFLVSILYIGWYRRELDYMSMGPDPEAADQGPPVASVSGALILVLVWLVAGHLPLAIRALIQWFRARK